MAEILLLRKRRRRKIIQQHRQWMLIDRSNPFSLENRDFIDRYRLSKRATEFLFETIKPYMREAVNGYSVEIQVLSMLRLFATGSFQKLVSESQYFQVSQTFISVTLEKFLNAMMDVAKSFIQFPRTDEQLYSICRGFYRKFRFPNVVGAIDCTHIRMKRPVQDDFFVFMDRTSHFSMNIQMVCDSDLKILDVVARWPGSAHDTFIWQLSTLRSVISSFPAEKFFLLGDSGYPLEPWLMTPYLDPCCPREHTYNAKHRTSRNVIERCFGVLKGRFRILHESGGTLQYTPEKVCKITIAAAVLHNICRLYDDLRLEEPLYPNDDNSNGNTNNSASAAGLYFRNKLATYLQERV